MADTHLPKISVVVTCFNCPDYVVDAIRSVARQTLRDFDCVIVDDASNDNSAEVVQRTLDELNDSRFSLVRLPKMSARPAPRVPGSPGPRRRSSAFWIRTICGTRISSSAISPPT